MVWGGIHPTKATPKMPSRAVDAICMGDGDVSFLRCWRPCNQGRDYRQDRRLLAPRAETESSAIRASRWSKTWTKFRSWISSLKSTTSTIRARSKRMDKRLMKKYYGGKLWTMFSQGRPYKCTFCSNDVLIDLDRGYRQFRKHSVEFFWRKSAVSFPSIRTSETS